MAADAGDRRVAAPGHADVDHGQLRLPLTGGARRGIGRIDGRDHAESRVGLQQLADGVTDDILVVGQQHGHLA